MGQVEIVYADIPVFIDCSEDLRLVKNFRMRTIIFDFIAIEKTNLSSPLRFAIKGDPSEYVLIENRVQGNVCSFFQ